MGYVVEVYSRKDENDAGNVTKAVSWLIYSLLNQLNPFIPRFFFGDGVWLLINEDRVPVGGMIELATDITARKQVEEDLRVSLVDAERTGQAETDFLATMSHEPRTPLNAIIRFSQTMSGQYFGALGSDKYIAYANDIGDSGEHLLHLINDIMDSSMIQDGKHEFSNFSLHKAY